MQWQIQQIISNKTPEITEISKTHEIAHFELGYKLPFLEGKLHSGEYFNKLEKYEETSNSNSLLRFTS